LKGLQDLDLTLGSSVKVAENLSPLGSKTSHAGKLYNNRIPAQSHGGLVQVQMFFFFLIDVMFFVSAVDFSG